MSKEQKHLELASRCIKAGSRVYFIDAKQDSKGHNYIVLSETKTNPQTGKRDKHRIFLYEEDFAKFTEAFNEIKSGIEALSGLTQSQVQEEESLEIKSSSIEYPKLEELLQD